MKKIKAKDFFNREIELDESLHHSTYIDEVVAFIKTEYGIDTDRSELLIDFKRVLVMDHTSRKIEGIPILKIKPSQKLLKKFEANYPEMII